MEAAERSGRAAWQTRMHPQPALALGPAQLLAMSHALRQPLQAVLQQAA